MIGKVTARVVTTHVVTAHLDALEKFTRQELRDYAKSLGVERGQNKRDTIRNLLLSGKATLLAQLGD